MTTNTPGQHEAQAVRRRPTRRPRKGLIIVNTGDGKGKTTAALGVALRASGHGFKTLMVQFIKGSWKIGELKAAGYLPGFDFHPMGEGFSIPGYSRSDLPDHLQAVANAWAFARERALSGAYGLVILDEINYVLSNPQLAPALPKEEVLDFLRQKPPMLHVVLTGRRALPEVIDLADLVTEMRVVKHPWRDQGIPAQKGIEF